MLLKIFVCLLLHIPSTVSQNLDDFFTKTRIYFNFSFFFHSLDGFDVRKIRIIEPPHERRSASTDASTIPTEEVLPAVPTQVSRKRPFDHIDDSSVSKEEQKQQRPRKKARIDVHALVFPELYDHHTQTQHCPKKKPQSNASALIKSDNQQQVQRFSIFPNPSRKASRAINQRFLSQIRRQTPADESNNEIS